MAGDDGLDLSRREFMQVGTTSLLAIQSGGLQVSSGGQPNEQYEFQGVADLIGPADARPAAGSDFFDNKVYYAYRYQETDGDQFEWYITQDDSQWTNLSNTMSNPQTQVDEVRVEDFTSFFNHTFSRPGAPDTKNWAFVDADVTKSSSEIELASTTGLIGKQRGNYPPGSEAIPGVAFRVTATPTGGECFAGYFADTDDDQVPDEGFGFGSDATSDFAFLAKGGTIQRIRQADWNGVSVSDRPFITHYPRICRFPHLFYGGGAIRWRIVDHDTDDGTPTPTLKTVHTETPESAADYGAPFDDGPPFDQPNLPPAFTSNGLTGGAIRANASHYESGEDESENRINGEFFGGSSGTSVGQTGWTHLMSWRKRDGWDMVNVKPFKVGVIAESSDVQLELQLGSDIGATDADFSLPTHTDSNGSAVEVTSAGSLNTAGQRRWVGFSQTGGSGAFSSSPGLIGESSLDFNLPGEDVVTLAANGVGGSATVWGYVSWEEYF